VETPAFLPSKHAPWGGRPWLLATAWEVENGAVIPGEQQYGLFGQDDINLAGWGSLLGALRVTSTD